MKHTPGPWKAVEALDRHYKPCGYSVWQDLERPYLDSPIGNKICQTPDGTTEQKRADACLIAAAPLMFEVFQAIASGNFEDKESFHEWAKGRAAVVLDAVETGC